MLLLSAKDKQNPFLRQIADLANPPRKVVGALRLEDIVSGPGFPKSFIGRDVVFGKFAGTFKGFSPGEQKLIIRDAANERDCQISVKMFPVLQTERPAVQKLGTSTPTSRKSPPESLFELALSSDFPRNCVGKVVNYLERTYLVAKMTAGGSRFDLTPIQAGRLIQVSIEHLKRAAKQRTAPT